MLQAPMFDGDAVDAGALGEGRFIPAEVGVGRRHVAQALIVSLVIIVLDEGLDLGFEIAGQKVVLQKLLSILPAFGSSDMSGVKNGGYRHSAQQDGTSHFQEQKACTSAVGAGITRLEQGCTFL